MPPAQVHPVPVDVQPPRGQGPALTADVQLSPGQVWWAGRRCRVLSVDELRTVLEQVVDPEIPVLTIADLGVLRDVELEGDRVVVTVTPTYSGCPAMEEIRADVLAALSGAGVVDAEVRTVLAPAWTTDWMTTSGREKLEAFGIAPPTGRRAVGPVGLGLPGLFRGTAAVVRCPQCGSGDTEELSRFASTSCKSLWRCRSCREPFDHFKDH